ncbi:MAG: lamin tail domain-containing protein [Ruminococcaceae bacterium]|nr:lamin tail domain-containing protein [Oscillospiraceae bacterium]
MKRIVSLLLATLMVVAILPIASIVAMAVASDTSPTTTTYQVYKEDFERLDENATSDEVLNALGWYVPASNKKENIAEYSVAVTTDGDTVVNKALHIYTGTDGIGGLDNCESFVTVFNGDVMSIVRNGSFVLSYDLTYRAGTVNANGYTAMIYNYNEESGFSVLEENAAIYGIVAVRACGAGMNNVYYPISGGSSMAALEFVQNGGEHVMSNRYTSKGQYPSLYARIAGTQDPITGELIDGDYVESEDTELENTVRLIDKTLHVKIDYNYEEGVSVFINDVLVSAPNVGYNANEYANDGIWKDFIDRTTSAAIGLVTKADVSADIDNIEIVAERIGDSGFADSLPELVITEVNPYGYDPNGANNYTWAEYVEIYNTSNAPVDLADYSLMMCDVTAGSAEDMLIGTKLKKYANYQNFGDILGKPLVSKTAFYVPLETLKTYGSKRFQFVDANTTLQTGARYRLDGASYVRDDDFGTYCKINYIETWNGNYVQGNSSYNYNTLLNPGECALVYLIQDKDTIPKCWTEGVNAGSTNLAISGSNCFRRAYASYGLTQNVKVFAMNAFNLADNPTGTGNRRYYIGKANYDDRVDDQGKPVPIKYTDVYISDVAHDKYVVSYVDWNSSVVAGVLYEGQNPNDTFFGVAGYTGPSLATSGTYGLVTAAQKASYYFSGVYVYGTDVSGDVRRGTLYRSNQRVNNGTAHVGALTGYQKILMQDMYEKAQENNGALAELMITEIVPRTLNLSGEELNAFSAVELTNTSSETLDLYRYALVRTKLDDTIGKNDKFSFATVMQPGNPVKKGEGNGAYYYFADNCISNPEECILAPGETVVIWFLTADTYQAYGRDEDFGFDYFRQYWVNHGNAQLAFRNADGNYATKVIAVDANDSAATNIDNAGRVFTLSANYSAVYGVAFASSDVKRGLVKPQDVLSTAYLGACSTYYDLKWSEVKTNIGTYYANILTRTMPANTAMRYIPGAAGNSYCSAMVNSMRVQYWDYAGVSASRPWVSETDPNANPAIKIWTNDGTVEPRLGTLDGEEALAIQDYLFVSDEDESGNVTYRYFDSLRTNIITLEGAAIRTEGTQPALRFDNAVANNIYNALIATYGKDIEIGMLIVETEQLGDLKVQSESDLIQAGVPYNKVASKVLYRSDDFTVLGSTVNISADHYDTSYTAIGYMSVKISDTVVKYYLSTTSTERSLADVAKDALDDTQANKDDVYCYASGDGAYSRLTPVVQNKLRGYLGL